MGPIAAMDVMATSIPLDPKTREMLRALGEKGESYDAIIRRLIKEAGWNRLDARWNKILEDDASIPLEDL